MSNGHFFFKRKMKVVREKKNHLRCIFVPSKFNRTVLQNIPYTSYCNNSQALMEKRSFM